MNEGRREGQVWQRLAKGKSRAVSVEVKHSRNKTHSAALSRAEAAFSPVSPQKTSHPVAPSSAAPPEAGKTAKSEEQRPIALDNARQKQPPTSSAVEEKSAREGAHKRPIKAKKNFGEREQRRIKNKLTISEALSEEEEQGRSLAALRRARAKEREKQLQQPQKPSQPRSRVITLPETITVADLANRMAVRSAEMVKRLLKLGAPATVNESIDADTAELLAQEFGHSVKRVSDSDIETSIAVEADDPTLLRPKPPVVSIMGHVDHGKTSILDALRKTSLASKEAGGITQHIGAYQVDVGEKKVTFIDTPGHQAFSKMRARGAIATDIVALVVAADDGVKEQTVESIKHAKLARTPIVVVVNKMDAPGADPNKVYTQLLEHEVAVEAQKGDVLSVEVSAKENRNLDKLLESLLLQAELMELKANPKAAASAVVLEARMDLGRGPMATVIIKRGVLNRGDAFVAGNSWGRVRALLDWQSKPMEEATPGQPARIQGFSSPPEAGDEFTVTSDEAKAREIAEYRNRRGGGREFSRLSPEEQMKQAANEAKINIVIKADTHGSVEALAHSLTALGDDKTEINIIHKGIGDVNESDADLASLAGGFIVAFAVRVNKQAQEGLKRHNTSVISSVIIYEAENAVKEHIELLQKGEDGRNLTELGKAEVLQVFDIGKIGKIAGCRITEGKVRSGCVAKVKRSEDEVFSGKLSSLKHEKSKVGELNAGQECGLRVGDFEDYRQGDTIEFYTQS